MHTCQHVLWHESSKPRKPCLLLGWIPPQAVSGAKITRERLGVVANSKYRWHGVHWRAFTAVLSQSTCLMTRAEPNCVLPRAERLQLFAMKVAGQVQGLEHFLKRPVDPSPHSAVHQFLRWRAFLYSTLSCGSLFLGYCTKVLVCCTFADNMLSSHASWIASQHHYGPPQIWASRRSNK